MGETEAKQCEHTAVIGRPMQLRTYHGWVIVPCDVKRHNPEVTEWAEGKKPQMEMEMFLNLSFGRDESTFYYERTISIRLILGEKRAFLKKKKGRKQAKKRLHRRLLVLYHDQLDSSRVVVSSIHIVATTDGCGGSCNNNRRDVGV
jgi:hypothetical protein